MKTDTVKLKIKFWVFWTTYCSLFAIITESISFYPYFELKRSLGIYFLILIYGLLTFGLHFTNITLEDDSISSTLLFLTCRIHYSQIEKIKSYKNKVKIYGEKEVITINNLEYTNFDNAVRKLSPEIDNLSQISLEGKTKYIKQYFA